jgi:hypothetical protein
VPSSGGLKRPVFKVETVLAQRRSARLGQRRRGRRHSCQADLATNADRGQPQTSYLRRARLGPCDLRPQDPLTLVSPASTTSATSGAGQARLLIIAAVPAPTIGTWSTTRPRRRLGA